MASALLASALNKYVGTILGPVVPTNVSLEARGCLTLTDITILPAFLNSLRLPIHTLSARVEKVSIKINPRKLRIEVLLEGLDLLSSTAVHCEGPEAKVELENAIQAKLKTLAGDEYLQLGGAPFDVWGYFGFAKFIAISIVKTHIRVQHSDGGDIALGLVVGHLGINSLISGRPLTAQKNYLGLPLTMSQLSLYLNTSSESEFTLPFTGRRSMRTPFRPDFEACKPEYVLEQLTAALLLQNQTTNAELPFLTLQLSSPAFGLSLSQAQFAKLFDFLAVIFANQKSWADISADAVKQAQGRPGTSVERAAYMALYKATLNTDEGWLPHMQEEKDMLERSLLAQDIMAWRRDAIQEVKAHKRHAQQASKGKHTAEPRVTLRPTVNKLPFIAAGALAVVFVLLYLWHAWGGVSIGFHTPFTVFIGVLMLGSLARGVLSLFAQPPPAYTSKGSGAPVFRLSLKSDSLSVTLVECLQLRMAEAEIAYGLNMADGGMDVALKTSLCEINDSRKMEPTRGAAPLPHQLILPNYRQFLRTGPLQVGYLQSSTTVAHPCRRISLSSKDFEIVMGHHSPVWVAMYFFNLPPKPASEAKEIKQEVKQEVKEVKEQLAVPTTPPAAPVSLHIEVDLTAKIKVVCSNTQPITNILELDLTTIKPVYLDMKDDLSLSTTVTLAASLIRDDLENKLEPYDPVEVLAPFQVKVYFHTFPSDFFPGQSGMSVDVDVETIDLTFTAELYRLLMNNVLQIVVPPPAPGTPAAPAAGAAAAPPVEYKAPLSYGSQSVALTTKQIKVRMLNDLLSSPSPLARVLLDDINARVHAFGHERSIFARLDVQAEFYNIAIVEWEPMVEPFNILITTTQAIHPTKYPNPKLSLVSHAEECKKLEREPGFLDDQVTQFNDFLIKTDKVIDLNITHAMNSRIQDVMSIVSTLFDAPSIIVDKDKPYLFENLTEFKIDVVSFDGVDRAKTLIPINPYSSTPFYMRDPNPHNHKVTVEFKGMPWAPLAFEIAKVLEFSQTFAWEPPRDDRQPKPESQWKPDHETKMCENCGTEFTFTLRRHHCRDCGLVFCANCSKDRVNDKRHCIQCFENYQVRRRQGIVPVSLVVSVEVRNGIKYVSLHSPIGLKNETSSQLHLTLPLSPAAYNWNNAPSTELHAKGEIREFAPGQTWWVPLLEAAYMSSNVSSAFAKVFLRPADVGKKFKWSKPISLKHPPVFPACKAYECAGKVQKMGQVETARIDYSFTVLHEGDAKHPPKASTTLYHVRDSILVENVLSTNVHVQLLSRVHRNTGVVVGEANIEKGKVFHAGASNLEPTFMKIGLPGYDWSGMIDLKLLDNHNEADRHHKAILQQTGTQRQLTVELEVLLQPGTIRVVLYVPYWLFDLTTLQLRFSDDQEVDSVVESETKLNDIRVAKMFNFSRGRKKLFVRARTSKWCSKPVSIDNTGLAGQLSLPGIVERQPELLNGIHYEVGMIVKAAEGRYSRTKVVEFAPRYVLQNSLPHSIIMHQYETQTPESNNLVRLQPGQSEVFHSRIKDPKGRRPAHCALSFRRVGDEALNAFNWSGYFDLDAVGDQTLSILDRNTLRCFYARILVRLEGPTIFVRVAELLTPVPGAPQNAAITADNIVALRYGVHYAIENRTSSQALRIRQARDDKRDLVLAAEESLWQDIEPDKWIPYDFTEPLHIKKLEVQCCVVTATQDEQDLGELKLIAFLETDAKNGGHAMVQIKNISARGLTAKDRNLMGKLSNSDPYVTLRVGPGGGPLQRTRVIRKTLHPEWTGEAFTFVVNVDEIPFKSLEMVIWDEDTVKDEIIGHVNIPLGALPWLTPEGGMPSASHKLTRYAAGHKQFAHTLDQVDINILNPQVGKWGGGNLLARRKNKLYLFVAADGPVNVLVLSNEPCRKYEPYASDDLFEHLQQPRVVEHIQTLVPRPIAPVSNKIELNLMVFGGRNFASSDELYCKIEFMRAVAQTECVKPVDRSVRWNKKFTTVLRQDRLQRGNAKFTFTLYARRDITSDKLLGSARLSWTEFSDNFEEKHVPFLDSAGTITGEIWLKFRKRDLLATGTEESRRGSVIPVNTDDSPHSDSMRPAALDAPGTPTSSTRPDILGSPVVLVVPPTPQIGLVSSFAPTPTAADTLSSKRVTFGLTTLAEEEEERAHAQDVSSITQPPTTGVLAPSPAPSSSASSVDPPSSSSSSSSASSIPSTAATTSTATATPTTTATATGAHLLSNLAPSDSSLGLLSSSSSSNALNQFSTELKSEKSVFDLERENDEDPNNEVLLTHIQLSLLQVDALEPSLGALWKHIQCEGVVEVAWPGLHRIAAFLIKDDNGIVDFQEWDRKMDIYIPNSILANADVPHHVKIAFWIERETYQHFTAGQKDEFEGVHFPFKLGEIDIDLAEVPLDDFEEDLENIAAEKNPQVKNRMLDELKDKREQVEAWKSKWCVLEHVQRVDDVKSLDPRLQVRVYKQKCRAYNRRPFSKITLDVDGIGASLIDAVPQEIAYFTINKVFLRLEDAIDQKTMEAKVGHLQLDNQQSDAVFDVVLAPTAVPVASRQPTIQMTSILLKDPRHSVVMYQDFSVLLQKLDIKIEEMLLWRLLSYMNQFYSAVDLEAPSERDASLAVKIPPIMDGVVETLFFRLLQLHPIAINLSFHVASPDARSGGQTQGRNGAAMLLTTVLSAFTAFAGSIADAPLRLNAKICPGVKGDRAYLTQVFMNHYIQQAIMETYKLLGSFEFLGNPVGFANNMSEGMTDFFYEPAQGLMKSPQDFGKGLAKGSTSLLTHTLGGVFGMASTFTGAVGNFGAALSMDDDFIKQRAMKSGGGPKHAVSGLTDGGKSVASGIIGGVRGVIYDPLKGAQQDGGMGFVKGVGKGLVGLAVKPTVGIIDGVSTALKGIGNTADYLLNEQCVNKPVRMQRYMPDQTLLRYSEGEKKRPPAPPKQNKMQQAFSGS